MRHKPASLRELFEIDSRSLSLFRVSLALIILYDLAVRATDLSAFYTDAGILPRSAWLNGANPWVLSVHLVSGSAWVQGALFLVQALCAVALLAGYRTRLATVLSWFLMASLQRRNALILGGADNYLRMLLFWSLFLPLGLRHSVDNRKSGAPSEQPVRVFNLGTVAILLQTVFVYVITALHKWRGESWREGSALFGTLQLDLYAKEISSIFLQYPSQLRALSHCVIWFESLGVVLLFVPFFTGPVRTFACLLFMSLQIGFHLFLNLDLFPAVSMAAMTLFLPSWFWERVFKRSAPSIPVRDGRGYRDALAVFFLLLAFFWITLPLLPSKPVLPKPLRNIGTFVYIDQAWRMFSPNPAKVSGWMVIPGVLQDGSTVDLWKDGAPVSWEKPPQREMFKNERWRKLLIQFILKDNKGLHRAFASYLCRSWNRTHSGAKKLRSLEIDLMTRKISLKGPSGEYAKKTLLRYECHE